jgi:hypothetical protein
VRRSVFNRLAEDAAVLLDEPLNLRWMVVSGRFLQCGGRKGLRCVWPLWEPLTEMAMPSSSFDIVWGEGMVIGGMVIVRKESWVVGCALWG